MDEERNKYIFKNVGDIGFVYPFFLAIIIGIYAGLRNSYIADVVHYSFEYISLWYLSIYYLIYIYQRFKFQKKDDEELENKRFIIMGKFSSYFLVIIYIIAFILRILFDNKASKMLEFAVRSTTIWNYIMCLICYLTYKKK